MDLHEFSNHKMYFDEELSSETVELLDQASENYGTQESELALLKAHMLNPKSFTVLVGLYRFYYYEHRLDDALFISERVLATCCETLSFPTDWNKVTLDHLASGVIIHSMGLVRFYLSTLKCTGYLNIRLENTDLGLAMMKKVLTLDEHDRLGTADLIKTISRRVNRPRLVESNSMSCAVGS